MIRYDYWNKIGNALLDAAIERPDKAGAIGDYCNAAYQQQLLRSVPYVRVVAAFKTLIDEGVFVGVPGGGEVPLYELNEKNVRKIVALARGALL